MCDHCTSLYGDEVTGHVLQMLPVLDIVGWHHEAQGDPVTNIIIVSKFQIRILMIVLILMLFILFLLLSLLYRLIIVSILTLLILSFCSAFFSSADHMGVFGS